MDLSRFSIPGNKDLLTTLRLQNFRLIKLRWFYIGVLTIVAATSSFAAGMPSDVAKEYVSIGAITLLINAMLFLINRIKRITIRKSYALMVAQLALDLGVASFVTYGQGGLEARTTLLFVIPIISAGLIFAEKIVYLTAFFSSLAYIFTIWLANMRAEKSLEFSEVIVPAIFYPALFLLLARLVSYLLKISIADTRDQAYDTFLALLSHQLIHPASTARAIIDQLERTPRGAHADIKKYINMLKAENSELLQLLNNLLETSSEYKISGEQEIKLNELLESVAETTAGNHDRVSDLVLDLGNNEISVFGLKPKLVTVLVNILNNAFQYSKQGTPVKLTLRRSGTDALIVIEDQGGGISDISRKNLFKKYNVSTEGSHSVQGLGLGLYVSRKIIQAHRGSLHLFSDKIGTRVMIKLKRGKHHE